MKSIKNQSTKAAHGGPRQGSGAKKKGKIHPVMIRLTDDELQAYKDFTESPDGLRYLLRKATGLCVHDIQTTDEKGILICTQCGAISPETFPLKPKNNG